METIGKYRFHEKLGSGSLGTAYLSYDAVRDHPVVIRPIGPGIQWDADLRERFAAESRSIPPLRHPNIAVVHEYGEDEGFVYIVMEYMPGADLKTLVAEKTPMTLEQKLSIIIQVASGLSHAHDHGILHRNLRPGNIHILPDGTAKVADLSIPGMLSAAIGSGGGTENHRFYMAPEQLQGSEATPQSDIFSVGVILYEFITGTHPFQDEAGSSVPGNIMQQGQFPTLERFPELPLSLWPILSRCLAKDAEDRYVSMAEFGAACRGLLDELGEDSQLMRIELQSALPGLRRAARDEAAHPEAARLLGDIESALSGKTGSDYQRLNLLIGALVEQSHMFRSTAESTVSAPASEVAELRVNSADSMLQENNALQRTASPTAQAGDSEKAEDASPALSESMEGKDSCTPEFMEMERRVKDTSYRETDHSIAPTGSSGERQQVSSIESAYPIIEDIPTASSRSELRKMTLWLCAAALALTLALAVPYLMQPRSMPDVSGRLPASVTFPESTGVTGTSGNPATDAAAVARRDILLEEARALYALGRLEESGVFLKRLLETHPDHEPAIQELERIEEESAALSRQDNPPPSVQKLLASASSAMQAGNFQKAQSDLDRAEKLQKGSADVAAMRRRLAARTSELALRLANEQKTQQEALRQKAAEITALRSGELFRQGKYGEAIALVEEQHAQQGTMPRTEDIRVKAVKAQNSLKAYEASMSAARPAEALAALSEVERLNPADPRLSSLRHRAEAGLSPGNAVLSVYPLGEAATLIFDGQTVGTDGEWVRQRVAAGRHMLSAKSEQGTEVVLDCNFSNGQEISLVYDMARGFMRPMTESDREEMRRNKAKQQVHSFAVEHAHGFLRGSCRGELTVSYYDVTYKPDTGSHRFSLPFKALKLRIENRTAVLLFATDDKEFETFKFEDAAAALAFKKTWDDLAALHQ